MPETSAESILGQYNIDDDLFRISAVNSAAPPELLQAYGQAIADVLHTAWQTKFVPDVLSQQAIDELPSGDTLAGRIAHPIRHARYLIAASGALAASPPDVQAFMRVEVYKPSVLTGRVYPNITDLESRTGRIAEGRDHVLASALCFHGLRFAQAEKVSAYTEAANPDGIAFFTRIGFVVKNTIDGRWGNELLTYTHMETKDRSAVLAKLLQTIAPHAID